VNTQGFDLHSPNACVLDKHGSYEKVPMICVHEKIKFRTAFSSTQQCTNRQKNVIFNQKHFLIYATPFRRFQLVKSLRVLNKFFFRVSFYLFTLFYICMNFKELTIKEFVL
jgi:hypothetical protein